MMTVATGAGRDHGRKTQLGQQPQQQKQQEQPSGRRRRSWRSTWDVRHGVALREMTDAVGTGDDSPGHEDQEEIRMSDSDWDGVGVSSVLLERIRDALWSASQEESSTNESAAAEEEEEAVAWDAHRTSDGDCCSNSDDMTDDEDRQDEMTDESTVSPSLRVLEPEDLIVLWRASSMVYEKNREVTHRIVHTIVDLLLDTP